MSWCFSFFFFLTALKQDWVLTTPNNQNLLCDFEAVGCCTREALTFPIDFEGSEFRDERFIWADLPVDSWTLAIDFAGSTLPNTVFLGADLQTGSIFVVDFAGSEFRGDKCIGRALWIDGAIFFNDFVSPLLPCAARDCICVDSCEGTAFSWDFAARAFLYWSRDRSFFSLKIKAQSLVISRRPTLNSRFIARFSLKSAETAARD